MKILYVGYNHPESTSAHRVAALRRLGASVTVLDPSPLLPRNRYTKFIHNRTGWLLLQPKIRSWIQQMMPNASFDLGWIDHGEHIGEGALKLIGTHCAKLVNYQPDDPTGLRDGRRWLSYMATLPHYDLCVVPRTVSCEEFPAHGARNVFRIWFSADEIAHRQRILMQDERVRWESKVAFVGTWMPERGPLIRSLVAAGIPVSIWGDRWHKAPEWAQLRPHWRGGAVYGDNYAAAVQCSVVALGLLSKGNRDQHTTRSAEIPALAGCFCAERTDEHCALYEEGVEALFWSDSDECVHQCRRLLADPMLARKIAERGHQRWLASSMSNEKMLRSIITEVSRLSTRRDKR